MLNAIRRIFTILLLIGVGFVALGTKVEAQTCGSQLVVDYYNCTNTQQDWTKPPICELKWSGQGTYSCSMQGNQCQTNSTVCSSNNNSSVCYVQGNTCLTDFSKCGKNLCWVSGGGGGGGGGSCGNGTCGSGESCSNCPADCGTCSSGRCEVEGKVEKYDNANLNNANEVVSLWSSLGVNTAGTNNSGNYVFSKNYDNVGDTIKVYVNNPYGTYRTFKVKGNVPNGCSIQDDGKTISCPKEKCYEREDGDLAFNFEEVAPSRPDAKISNVNNLKYGETLTWTVEATDADGNLESTGIYYDRGEPAIGAASWKPLGWVGGQNVSALTYEHSKGWVTPWVCNAGNQGTWTLATNAKDKTGLECSGDPTGSATRCASGLS